MNKKLYRSENNKIIAGVAGGLAEYFDIDSTVMRLIFVLVTAFGGSGLLIYVVLWLIMPKNQDGQGVVNEDSVREFAQGVKEKVREIKGEVKEEWEKKKMESSEMRKGRGGFFGWVLLIIGLLFLANKFFPFWYQLYFFNFWPLLLVLAGLILIVRAGNKK